MSYLIKLYRKTLKYPFGKKIFSSMVARKAPFFKTIRPRIEELRPNYIEVSMPKRRSVLNHIQTVHAIACCNLCEFAAGVCMEASIPKHRRWIPQGMDVRYLKKAETDLYCICDLSQVNWEKCEEVICVVDVKDTNENVVVSAKINMKVSNKKSK